ncbi:MAG: sugar phosphate isomerase/epimerase [Spirochaetaceae bacterium]|nr:sugar phosphate isomerase/epimerase [Spirochaetaceae bacterium]
MKHAVCNEMFGTMEFSRAANMLAEEGFTGIEVAPYTLFGDFSAEAVRRGGAALRAGLASSGLAFVGFHWIFGGPEFLHFTSPDAASRKKAADRLEFLLDMAGDLGGGVIVFGSPKERASGGAPREDALSRLGEGLAAAAARAEKAGCRILLEALPSSVTDTVNTLGEAEKIIRAIGRPGVSGMFDFDNTADETESWDGLIARYWDIIQHVHIRGRKGEPLVPGTEADYRPAFSVLRSRGFAAWVSLEIFTVPHDPRKVLRETLGFLKEVAS